MNVEHSFPTEAQSGRADLDKFAVVRWLKKRRWFIIAVVLPTFLAIIYYGLFASDIYISESRFVIKSLDQRRSQMTSLASLIQTTGLSGGQEQTNEVLDYVRSRDALQALDKNPGVRGKFGSPDADFLSRFPMAFFDNTFEDLYNYYGKMVSANLNTETGIASITVKAFSPQDAYKINKELLNLSESMVNRLSARAQNRGIVEAQKQVDLAEKRAKEARLALTQYRNSQSVVDPSKQAVGVIEIANEMIAQRAVLQAQLDSMRRLTPGNPSIPAMQNRIAALSAQISSQDSRVVGPSTGIASKIGGYENLQVEQEFATESLTAANAALVQARAEALRQQFYLERLAEPNIPDRPELPRRFLSVLIVAASALCLYFIGWMLVVGILEHAPDD